MNELEQAREIIDRVDQQMARLYRERMEAVRQVARYKQERGIPVLDAERESQVIEKNAQYVEEDDLRDFYALFLRDMMKNSRAYQRRLLNEQGNAKTLHVELGETGYDIFLQRGALKEAGQFLDLNRTVLVVTDDGVPPQYARTVADQCRRSVVVTLPQGESTKNFAYFQQLCRACLEAGLTRKDCIVAVGGGVMGDLAGFAAASYMRGIDFYNIPTTVLSQVDSSIGGKVAIDLDNVKNIVGAFHQPRGVIVDPDVLTTLPSRQIANGLAEAVKMGLILDEELFALFEEEEPMAQIDEIIRRALEGKRYVVQEDEKELGLRRILNFGHTIGHGIESQGGRYHGECVALGMIPMCAPAVRARLLPVLQRLGLPAAGDWDNDAVMEAVLHDKKAAGDKIHAIFVEEIGQAVQRAVTREELKTLLEEGWQ